MDDVKKQILYHPYKRFELMNVMKYDSNTECIELDNIIWEQLSAQERDEICLLCDMNIEQYYSTIS